MNTCKDCKWWKEKILEADYERLLAPFGAGNCSSEKFVYQSVDEPLPKDGLVYWDFESYKAGFETGPDFGCIHWEQK